MMAPGAQLRPQNFIVAPIDRHLSAPPVPQFASSVQGTHRLLTSGAHTRSFTLM